MTATRTTQGTTTRGTTEKRLAALRTRINRIEAGSLVEDACGGARFVPLGLDDIDRHLPGGGLARGGVHDIVAGDDSAAALGFALWAIARMTRGRTWLWCVQDGVQGSTRAPMPYAPALADFGLKPRRLLLARTAFARETLWAAEEGLATPALGAVLAEATAVSDIAARRLALAARSSGVPLILLRPDDVAAAGPATTRWRVTGAPDGAWEIALLRAGGVFPRRWRVLWRGSEGAIPLPVDNDHMDYMERADDGRNDRQDAGATADTRPVAAASVRGAA
jgi:protein ImuA